MSNDWPQSKEFWEQLTRVDLARAEQVRREGCRDCGGPLDRSDYPRKPRGELGEAAVETLMTASERPSPCLPVAFMPHRVIEEPEARYLQGEAWPHPRQR
jgi:hypothetical protein